MDTWTNRDLPVLTTIVETHDEEGEQPSPEAIATSTGLSEPDVARALRALGSEQPAFLDGMESAMGGTILFVGTPTGHARRAVGAWPTAESLADRIVQGIEQAAEQVEDEEKRGWLKKTANYLGTAGRDVAVDIAATAVNRQMGM